MHPISNAYNFPHLKKWYVLLFCKDPFHSAAVCFYLFDVFVSCFAATTIHPVQRRTASFPPLTRGPRMNPNCWIHYSPSCEQTDGQTKGNSIVNYQRRLHGMGHRKGPPLVLFTGAGFASTQSKTSPRPSLPRRPPIGCGGGFPKCRRLNNSSWACSPP